MANDARLKIIIETMNNASKELKQLQGDLKSVDEAGKDADKSTGTFGENMNAMRGKLMLAAAAVVGVGVALKQTYDIAREGAELEFTAAKFDNLTRSIDATSDVMMVELRQATGYTTSNMEAMASATDFLSLGLAKTEEEAIRMATVAGQLGMNMNQLVLTLTNQTTMRFDALNVATDGFKERLKALEETGMDTNAAFTEAFLQQAEEQIERVGTILDEDIAGFMKFESALKNIADKTKREWSPMFAELADKMADVLNATTMTSDGIVLLNQDLVDGKISYDDYREAVDNLINPLGVTVDEMGNFATNSMQSVGAMNELRESTVVYTEDGAKMAKMIQDIEKYNASMKEGLEESTEAIDAAKNATNNAEEAMRAYSEALLFKIASEGLSSDQALDLAYAMGLVDERTVFATEKVQIYQQMLEDHRISQETYNALVAGLASALDGMPSDVNVDLWLNIHGYDDFQRVANAIGSGSGSSGQGTAGGAQPQMEASGGNVYTGNPYIWQEYSKGGAEAFIPSMDGYILSRSDAAAALASGGKSGGTTTYNLIINEAGGVVDPVGSIALLEAMAGG